MAGELVIRTECWTHHSGSRRNVRLPQASCDSSQSGTAREASGNFTLVNGVYDSTTVRYGVMTIGGILLCVPS
jgi:hypothetical protein